MAETVIEWDGKHLPAALQALEPGRYVISPVEATEIPDDEEAGIREALEEIEAGAELTPFDELLRDLEGRFQNRR